MFSLFCLLREMRVQLVIGLGSVKSEQSINRLHSMYCGGSALVGNHRRRTDLARLLLCMHACMHAHVQFAHAPMTKCYRACYERKNSTNLGWCVWNISANFWKSIANILVFMAHLRMDSKVPQQLRTKVKLPSTLMEWTSFRATVSHHQNVISLATNKTQRHDESGWGIHKRSMCEHRA